MTPPRVLAYAEVHVIVLNCHTCTLRAFLKMCLRAMHARYSRCKYVSCTGTVGGVANKRDIVGCAPLVSIMKIQQFGSSGTVSVFTQDGRHLLWRVSAGGSRILSVNAREVHSCVFVRLKGW